MEAGKVGEKGDGGGTPTWFGFLRVRRREGEGSNDGKGIEGEKAFGFSSVAEIQNLGPQLGESHLASSAPSLPSYGCESSNFRYASIVKVWLPWFHLLEAEYLLSRPRHKKAISHGAPKKMKDTYSFIRRGQIILFMEVHSVQSLKKMSVNGVITSSAQLEFLQGMQTKYLYKLTIHQHDAPHGSLFLGTWMHCNSPLYLASQQQKYILFFLRASTLSSSLSAIPQPCFPKNKAQSMTAKAKDGNRES
ncbi:hypothetical protein OPV22_015595 [Ensete ventricosum]|uniref:Uncharacterized protein n=1 Tax=Ensete ventricosum TaxID=4639 RepID=A0AAV8R602_ENSVE|nr:hypothetical protein OPV22_015595 [Ensete ventricosum]